MRASGMATLRLVNWTDNGEFLRRINIFARRANHQFPVQPLCEKYFAFPVGQINSTTNPVSPTEGRCATSSTRDGMRWTRMRA
jgi:hypothetical protein